MCETRKWNSLRVLTNSDSISITGERSDGALIRVYTRFVKEDNPITILEKVRDLIKNLEANRNKKEEFPQIPPDNNC